MNTEYHIEPSDREFIVIDPHGEKVGRYPTEEAAKSDIERCKRDDAMYESAKRLVDIAIKAHMKMFAVERDISRYWISSAMSCEFDPST